MLVQEADVRERLYKRRRWSDDFMLQIEGRVTVLDPTLYGNMVRFANNSCTAKERLEKFQLAGSSFEVVFIVALRNISVGEEVTVDYIWRQ